MIGYFIVACIPSQAETNQAMAFLALNKAKILVDLPIRHYNSPAH
jgi:hypothetical protein